MIKSLYFIGAENFEYAVKHGSSYYIIIPNVSKCVPGSIRLYWIVEQNAKCRVHMYVQNQDSSGVTWNNKSFPETLLAHYKFNFEVFLSDCMFKHLWAIEKILKLSHSVILLNSVSRPTFHETWIQHIKFISPEKLVLTMNMTFWWRRYRNSEEPQLNWGMVEAHSSEVHFRNDDLDYPGDTTDRNRG